MGLVSGALRVLGGLRVWVWWVVVGGVSFDACGWVVLGCGFAIWLCFRRISGFLELLSFVLFCGL